MVCLALVPMILNWLSDLSNWNLTLLPSESALALSLSPQRGSCLVAWVVHELELSPSETWMCSLPFTSPTIIHLFHIRIETLNPGLTVTFCLGNLHPACLSWHPKTHSPGLCLGFLPVTGALGSNLPWGCHPPQSPWFHNAVKEKPESSG